MKIIKPYARIMAEDLLDYSFHISDGINLLKKCEYAARVSHRSEDKITEDSYDKFLRFVVMEHGDFSVVEHASVTVEAVVDRGITHEWVRHRLGAYTQESTRFVNYQKKGELTFIDNSNIFNELANEACLIAYQTLEDVYNRMVQHDNIRPQEARAILPNGLASKIIVTYNLRMWRHFFLMRTSKETHQQFRQVTIPLLKEFQEKIPILYEDIIPESKQSDNLKKMR